MSLAYDDIVHSICRLSAERRNRKEKLFRRRVAEAAAQCKGISQKKAAQLKTDREQLAAKLAALRRNQGKDIQRIYKLLREESVRARGLIRAAIECDHALNNKCKSLQEAFRQRIARLRDEQEAVLEGFERQSVETLQKFQDQLAAAQTGIGVDTYTSLFKKVLGTA